LISTWRTSSRVRSLFVVPHFFLRRLIVLYLFLLPSLSVCHSSPQSSLRHLPTTHQPVRTHSLSLLPSLTPPFLSFADMIVPGMNNSRSIDLIVSHIQRQLSDRRCQMRGELYRETIGTARGSAPPSPTKSSLGLEGVKEECGSAREEELPDTVHVMRESTQLKVRLVLSFFLFFLCSPYLL
jgi:hypothetical protein